MVDARATGDVERALHLHGLRVEEVEPLAGLRDVDRVLAVGREVHVVRVVDGDRGSGLARLRVDRCEGAVRRALGVVGDPQGLQVVGRDDVLGVEPDVEGVDDLHRRRVDHRHRVREAVRDVDAREVTFHRVAELVGGGLAVEVRRVGHARHTGDGVDLLRRRGLRRRGRRWCRGRARAADGCGRGLRLVGTAAVTARDGEQRDPGQHDDEPSCPGEVGSVEPAMGRSVGDGESTRS